MAAMHGRAGSLRLHGTLPMPQRPEDRQRRVSKRGQRRCPQARYSRQAARSARRRPRRLRGICPISAIRPLIESTSRYRAASTPAMSGIPQQTAQPRLHIGKEEDEPVEPRRLAWDGCGGSTVLGSVRHRLQCPKCAMSPPGQIGWSVRLTGDGCLELPELARSTSSEHLVAVAALTSVHARWRHDEIAHHLIEKTPGSRGVAQRSRWPAAQIPAPASNSISEERGSRLPMRGNAATG